MKRRAASSRRALTGLLVLVAGTLLALAAMGLAAFPLDASAQTLATEADVKAAYLQKFLGFVDWPDTAFAQPDAPLVVGVVGDPAVQAALRTIAATRPERGHPVDVRGVAESDPVQALHVLFVGRAASPSRWAARVRGHPVLLVTDHARGLDSGGMLNFVPVDGRIRFEASLVAAQEAGLRLGARLLTVAERVITP